MSDRYWALVADVVTFVLKLIGMVASFVGWIVWQFLPILVVLPATGLGLHATGAHPWSAVLLGFAMCIPAQGLWAVFLDFGAPRIQREWEVHRIERDKVRAEVERTGELDASGGELTLVDDARETG